MDWSKDRWEQAWGRPAQCGFLRRVWPYPASGSPGSTCFYGWAGVPGAQSAVFLHAVETREFQRHVFLIAFGTSGAPRAVFSRAFWTLDLAPSRGGPGAARGGDSRRGSGPFSDCTVKHGAPGAQEHRTTVKMHVIEAPSVLPWGPLFSPRDYRALRAPPRIGVVRVWGRFRANLAGIAPWDAPQSVGEESVPTDSWGVRSPRPCGRAPFSAISHAFSRCGWHARGSRNRPPGPWRGPGPLLGRSWPFLGRSWLFLGVPGPLLRAPGPLLGAPGRSWATPGRS